MSPPNERRQNNISHLQTARSANEQSIISKRLSPESKLTINPHPDLLHAIDLTHDLMGDLLANSDIPASLAFTLSEKRGPTEPRVGIHKAVISLISQANRPKDTLPARFNVHLTHDFTTPHRGREIHIDTSLRKRVPRPPKGEKVLLGERIRQKDEEKIRPFAIVKSKSKQPYEARKEELKKEIAKDLKRALQSFTSPPGEPVEIVTFPHVTSKDPAA